LPSIGDRLAVGTEGARPVVLAVAAASGSNTSLAAILIAGYSLWATAHSDQRQNESDREDKRCDRVRARLEIGAKRRQRPIDIHWVISHYIAQLCKQRSINCTPSSAPEPYHQQHQRDGGKQAQHKDGHGGVNGHGDGHVRDTAKSAATSEPATARKLAKAARTAMRCACDQMISQPQRHSDQR
jgi:hypothetical protein